MDGSGRFVVMSNPEAAAVEAWSTERLPFEPKGLLELDDQPT
jgi:hypothetical protein